MKTIRTLLLMLLGMIVSVTLVSCDNDKEPKSFLDTKEYKEFFAATSFLPMEEYIDSEWEHTHTWGAWDSNWQKAGGVLKITQSSDPERAFEVSTEGQTYKDTYYNEGSCSFGDKYRNHYFYTVKKDEIILCLVILTGTGGGYYQKYKRIK